MSFNVKKHALFILALILVFLYFCSFFFNRSEEKSFDSAFLNSKYDISKIQLFSEDRKKLTVYIDGKFIYGELEEEGFLPLFFPCNPKMVQDLLEKARNVRRMYEISYKNESWKAFSLDSDSCFHLEFVNSDGKTVSSLDFGAINSSLSRIFFKTSSKENVYQTDTEIAGFLTCSPDFWAEQTLIPQQIAGNLNSSNISEIEVTSNFSEKITDMHLNGEKLDVASDRLPRFRHGKILSAFPPDAQKGSPLLSVSITDGTGKKFFLEFYPDFTETDDGNSYIVSFYPDVDSGIWKPELKNYFEKQKHISSSNELNMKISRWTFRQIVSLFE